MDLSDVLAALDEGHRTRKEIAEYVGLDDSHVGRQLTKMIERGELLRERQGRAYHYFRARDAGAEEADELPVIGDRDYSWGAYVPRQAETTEYVPSGDEWEQISAMVDRRHETGQLCRFILSGPPGTGKTTLAKWLAAERGWPCITIQCTYSMREADLLGSPKLLGEETKWADGPAPRALLSSQEQPTVLILDEVNRARPEAKTPLMPMLDSRCEVTIDARGNETIRGAPEDLIVIATMNEGPNVETQDMDRAMQDRLSNKWYVPHLGLEHPDQEAQLLVDETPAPRFLAEALVDVANDLRRTAREDGAAIAEGIATRRLIRWSRAAAALAPTTETPLLDAAESTVVDGAYDGEMVKSAVRELVKSHLEGDHIQSAAIGIGWEPSREQPDTEGVA